MRKNYFQIKNAVLTLTVFAVFANEVVKAQAPVTLTYSFTGSVQTFVVPACVGTITITARAAGGSIGGSSGSSGANGGAVRAVITATPGQTMFFNVGGTGSITAGGFNGGGSGGASSSNSGGGGGALPMCGS